MAAKMIPFPQADLEEKTDKEVFEEARFLQFIATIRDSDPAIWRRAIVPADMTLAALHGTMLALFGWSGEHCYRFSANDSFFDDPRLIEDSQPRAGEKRYPALDVPVEVVLSDGSTIDYLYDLGDCWEVEIECEGELDGRQYPFGIMPVCLDGERANPLEDVGGIEGYEAFCDAVNDPSNPEYVGLREWACLEPDEEFDPEDFSPFDANELFASVMIEQLEDEIVPSDPDELRAAYIDLLAERTASTTQRLLDVIHELTDNADA